MPFVYFYLDMLSTDGATHDIRVYSEINPRMSDAVFAVKINNQSLFVPVEWLHGNEVLLVDPDPKVSANGSLIDSTDFVGLQMQLQVPQPFSEVANHAQDAVGVYAIKSVSESIFCNRIFLLRKHSADLQCQVSNWDWDDGSRVGNKLDRTSKYRRCELLGARTR